MRLIRIELISEMYAVNLFFKDSVHLLDDLMASVICLIPAPKRQHFIATKQGILDI